MFYKSESLIMLKRRLRPLELQIFTKSPMCCFSTHYIKFDVPIDDKNVSIAHLYSGNPAPPCFDWGVEIEQAEMKVPDQVILPKSNPKFVGFRYCCHVVGRWRHDVMETRCSSHVGSSNSAYCTLNVLLHRIS